MQNTLCFIRNRGFKLQIRSILTLNLNIITSVLVSGPRKPKLWPDLTLDRKNRPDRAILETIQVGYARPLHYNINLAVDKWSTSNATAFLAKCQFYNVDTEGHSRKTFFE
jgi:hypothetical protein